MSIPENITLIRQQISHFEQKYDRQAGSVQLLAVSKTHALEKIRQARECGQFHIAENYVQEALDKIIAAADPELIWHFIGPIQSNKTRALAQHFDWIHTVDRLKIARRLSEHRSAEQAPLNVLIQVNISGESSKAGITLDELPALAAAISTLPHLVLAGLMTIPAPATIFAEQRQAFKQLRLARDQLLASGYTDCQHLSMGMSQDFEAAIAEGATLIRIGTAIFGTRNTGEQSP